MDIELVIKSTAIRVDFPNDLSLIQYTNCNAQNRQTEIQAKYLV